MKTQTLVALGAAIIGQGAARFRGHYEVYMQASNENQCYVATLDVSDTKLNLVYDGHVGCRANGPGQIASADFHCRVSDGVQDFADIHVVTQDTLKFCCEHFYTCMQTNHRGIDMMDGDTNKVRFDFNDDDACPC